MDILEAAITKVVHQVFTVTKSMRISGYLYKLIIVYVNSASRFFNHIKESASELLENIEDVFPRS